MAISVRNQSVDLAFATAQQFNAFKKEIAASLASPKPHADITSKPTTSFADYKTPAATPDLVTAANASDLATSVALANDVYAVASRHIGDALAHKIADVTNAVSSATATDLATAITRANDIKTKYEAHRASTSHHYVADSTNAIAAANATDQSSLNTLLNELKTDLNAHIQAGFTTGSLNIMGP